MPRFILKHLSLTTPHLARSPLQRMIEMLPDASVFLDVDDLKEGKGAEYVDVSCLNLVLISDGCTSQRD